MTVPAPDSTPDRLGDQLARRFRLLYTVALVLIACAAIAAQGLIQRAIAARESDARVVNLSGRQRMLSQRLVLHAWALTTARARNDVAASQRLAAVLAGTQQEWTAAHLSLREFVRTSLPDRSPAVDELFARMVEPMARLDADASLLGQPGTPVADDAAAAAVVLERMLADQDRFLDAMDAAVNALAGHFTSRLHRLRWLEIGLFLVTIVVLALEAWLVFRPLAGRLREAVNALEDQEKRVEKRLESLRYLAGGVAHNYNNLITSIAGNAELIRLECGDNAVVAEFAEHQAAECKRAARLTAQLLAYSGYGDYRMKAVLLSQVVQNALHRFDLEVRPRMTLTVVDDSVVAVDTEHLVQAVHGILANASEATAANRGAITLTLGREHFATVRAMSGAYRTELPAGTYACLEVRDEGSGMQQERVERIFDPFVTTQSPGRGLGLAAVLGVFHGHDGGVTVTSTLGAGTTVRLYLPVVATRAVPAPAQPSLAAGRLD